VLGSFRDRLCTAHLDRWQACGFRDARRVRARRTAALDRGPLGHLRTKALPLVAGAINWRRCGRLTANGLVFIVSASRG
jgi:hypothetical protein